MVARHDGSCNTFGGSAHGFVSHCGTQCAIPSTHGDKGMGCADLIFLSRSEDRAALILDTLNAESRPPVESSSHSRIPRPRPIPPPDADQPTLTPIDRHNSDSQHIRSLRPLVEADHTGGKSNYSLLPPVPVPHRNAPPPALSRTSINFTGRRSVSAPVPLSDNAIPPRTSLLHPRGALPFWPLPLLRTTNRPRGTHCCHMGM